MKTFFLVLLVLWLIAAGIMMAAKKARNAGMASAGNIYRHYWYVIPVFLALWVLHNAFVIVPAGHVVAIWNITSGVKPNQLDPGLHLIIPFLERAKLFVTQTQDYTMSIVPDEGAVKRDDSLDAPTSDGQKVWIDASVIFHIENAPLIWQKLGENYIEKILRPTSRSEIRMVISSYSAMEIYSSKRQEAEEVMTARIKESLEPRGIFVEKVLLRSVRFSDEYAKAIEQKVIAQQKIQQAAYEAEVAENQKKTTITKAQGEAEAQKLLKEQVTDETLRLRAIEKWDGKLPQVTGSNTPFINITP